MWLGISAVQVQLGSVPDPLGRGVSPECMDAGYLQHVCIGRLKCQTKKKFLFPAVFFLISSDHYGFELTFLHLICDTFPLEVNTKRWRFNLESGWSFFLESQFCRQAHIQSHLIRLYLRNSCCVKRCYLFFPFFFFSFHYITFSFPANCMIKYLGS